MKSTPWVKKVSHPITVSILDRFAKILYVLQTAITFQIRNFALYMHVKHIANVTLLSNIYPTDICQMSWKCVQRLTLCKYQHFTFCSFTVLGKLEALQLSRVGLSTIKYQHSKNLTPWADATWTKNTWKCTFFAWVSSQKVFKMSTICTDTCLEMLSPLISCSVDNVSGHMSVQMVFKVYQGNAATYLRCGG